MFPMVMPMLWMILMMMMSQIPCFVRPSFIFIRMKYFNYICFSWIFSFLYKVLFRRRSPACRIRKISILGLPDSPFCSSGVVCKTAITSTRTLGSNGNHKHQAVETVLALFSSVFGIVLGLLTLFLVLLIIFLMLSIAKGHYQSVSIFNNYAIVVSYFHISIHYFSWMLF